MRTLTVQAGLQNSTQAFWGQVLAGYQNLTI